MFIMTEKTYFAPETELLEQVPYSVYCTSPEPPIDAEGEDRDPWEIDE